jgi:hypothetical protein
LLACLLACLLDCVCVCVWCVMCCIYIQCYFRMLRWRRVRRGQQGTDRNCIEWYQPKETTSDKLQSRRRSWCFRWTWWVLSTTYAGQDKRISMCGVWWPHSEVLGRTLRDVREPCPP